MNEIKIMNTVNFHQKTKKNISSIVVFLLTLVSLITLPSCALLKHKIPAQQVLHTQLKTIHTLDVYAEKNTIHALFSGIGNHSQQSVLTYMFSSDAGNTWSSALLANQNLAPLKKSKRGNDFQIAAHLNQVMAVWQTQGGEPWTGRIAVALSKDYGQTWQQVASPVNEEYAKIDQGYFDLTADSLGQFHIVWLDDREEAGDTQGLRYARFTGDLWDQHQDLEATACTCCWASINVDKSNNVHVLFRDDSPRDMMLISSLNNGQSWQKSKTAGSFGWEFVGCPHQGGGLTSTQLNSQTILHSAIWNGKTSGKGVYYSQSKLNKDNISTLLSLADNSSASADIAALDDQRIGIVYTSGDFESQSIMTKFSTDGGLSWSNEHRLTGDGAEPSHPRIIATPNGYRFFWTEWLENGDAIAIISELE